MRGMYENDCSPVKNRWNNWNTTTFVADVLYC